MSAALPMPASRTPGSPWMPSPMPIWPFSTWNRASSAPGNVQPSKATPKERVASLAFHARRSASSRSAPASIAAPAILKTGRSPATPRRSRWFSGVLDATSSLTERATPPATSTRRSGWAATSPRIASSAKSSGELRRYVTVPSLNVRREAQHACDRSECDADPIGF